MKNKEMKKAHNVHSSHDQVYRCDVESILIGGQERCAEGGDSSSKDNMHTC